MLSFLFVSCTPHCNDLQMGVNWDYFLVLGYNVVEFPLPAIGAVKVSSIIV